MKRFHKFVALACLLAAAWACIVFDFVDVGADENVKFVVRAVRVVVVACSVLFTPGGTLTVRAAVSTVSVVLVDGVGMLCFALHWN